MKKRSGGKRITGIREYVRGITKEEVFELSG